MVVTNNFHGERVHLKSLLHCGDKIFFVVKQLYSIREMPHVLNVWMYECCSEVDSTMAEQLGNVIPRIFNWQVVEIKVKYEKFMTGMFSKFMYNNIRPTHKEVQSLNLQMIERFQLKEAECGLPPEIAADCSDKRLAGGVQLQEDLDIEEFEEFSTVPLTEILKKAGLITDDSTSHPSKKRKIVHFDSTTAEDQVCQKTTSFVSTRTVPTQKKASSGSERVYAKKTIPSSSLKSVYQDNSDEKWDDIKLILQSYPNNIKNQMKKWINNMPNSSKCCNRTTKKMKRLRFGKVQLPKKNHHKLK